MSIRRSHVLASIGLAAWLTGCGKVEEKPAVPLAAPVAGVARDPDGTNGDPRAARKADQRESPKEPTEAERMARAVEGNWVRGPEKTADGKGERKASLGLFFLPGIGGTGGIEVEQVGGNLLVGVPTAGGLLRVKKPLRYKIGSEGGRQHLILAVFDSPGPVAVEYKLAGEVLHLKGKVRVPALGDVSLDGEWKRQK